MSKCWCGKPGVGFTKDEVALCADCGREALNGTVTKLRAEVARLTGRLAEVERESGIAETGRNEAVEDLNRERVYSHAACARADAAEARVREVAAALSLPDADGEAVVARVRDLLTYEKAWKREKGRDTFPILTTPHGGASGSPGGVVGGYPMEASDGK